MRALACAEDEHSARICEFEGKGVGCRPTGADVFHEHRPRLSAIALPELVTVQPVGGPEEERSPDLYDLSGEGGAAAGADIAHEHGTCIRAVALPELPPVNAVLCRKEERPAHVRSRGRERAFI